MKLYAPWEKAFNRIATPFEHFIHAQTTTGLILFLTTTLTLIVANSGLSETYEHFIHLNIDFNVGEWKLSHSLQHWVNDGLMAIFFFMVGLEIKREILIGELSNIKDAMLPILAAIGGMVLPALIYIGINFGTEGVHGWGVPMATDIAFAISALVLLHKEVPKALVTFLVALAIVDDLGAVLVIALFYTEQIHLLPFSLAIGAFLVMLLFNRFGIHSVLAYFLVGVILWFFLLESGVHATISGIIAAIAIPSQPKLTPVDFTNHTKNLLNEYDNYPVSTDHTMHEAQKAILLNIKDRIDAVGSPSAKLEHDLHLPVSLVIIPLFALANAGVALDFSSIHTTALEPISLGIILGLLLGKSLGIFGVSWIAVKLGVAKLPTHSTFSQIFGVAILGAIGFTMSIFIADLAFLGDEAHIFQAKTAVLISSVIAGTLGFLWLKFIAKSSTSSQK